MNQADPPPLILASASPRRARLLEEAGVPFEQRRSPFDESAADLSMLAPRHRPPTLAQFKAAALAETLELGIVLGADTLLEIDGEALGKPADVEQARRALRMLIGRSHEAITGVCLIDASTARSTLLVDTATVRIDSLDEEEIERYLASERWRGKAGGYNLAEVQDRWPIAVEGDPTTVIGLPMRRLPQTLRSFAPHLLPPDSDAHRRTPP